MKDDYKFYLLNSVIYSFLVDIKVITYLHEAIHPQYINYFAIH